MNGWMDCTGIMKYLSLGLLILDMAVYLGGSAAEDQQPLFVGLSSHVFILAVKAGEILRCNPFRFNQGGDEAHLAACLHPAVQVRIDAGVSVRECRQKEMRRKRKWHIHCGDAEIEYQP